MICPRKGCGGILVGQGAWQRCASCGRTFSTEPRTPVPAAKPKTEARKPAQVKSAPDPVKPAPVKPARVKAPPPPPVRHLLTVVGPYSRPACGTKLNPETRARMTDAEDVVTCQRCKVIIEARSPAEFPAFTDRQQVNLFGSDQQRCTFCGQRSTCWAGCPGTKAS